MALSDRYLFSVLAESTYGTDAFSGSDPSNFLTVFGQPSLLEEYTDVADELIRANSSRDAGLRYGRMTSVSFEVPLIEGDGSSDTPPAFIDDILKACGYEETVNTGVDIVYSPKTAGGMSATPSMSVFLGIRDDKTGDYYKRTVNGVYGTSTISMSQSQEARISFEGMGLFSQMATSSAAATEPSSYNGGHDRFKVQGLTFDVGGTQYDVTTCELSLNQSAVADEVLTNSEEVDEIYLATSHEAPVMSVGFKGRSDVVADILTNVQPAADGTLTLPVVTVTATMGSRTIEIAGQNVKMGMYSESVNNSRYQYDMDLTFTSPLSSGGDDEMTITFA